MIAVPSGTIGSIGSLMKQNDGYAGSMSGKIVSAVFDDCFYIEEPNRCAGIRCTATGVDLQPGDQVVITGTLSADADGPTFDATSCEVTAAGNAPLPLGLSGRAVHSAQPNPFGLYVTVWGNVESVETGAFVMDDGSSFDLPDWNPGIQVDCTGTPAAVGDFVGVTGILCKQQVNGNTVAVLRTTSSASITVFAHQ